MSTQHNIIRAWCASCGMPEPSNGDCIALVAALTPEAEPLITVESSLRFRLEGAQRKIADLEDEVRELRGRLPSNDLSFMFGDAAEAEPAKTEAVGPNARDALEMAVECLENCRMDEGKGHWLEEALAMCRAVLPEAAPPQSADDQAQDD